jgi:hypothetical protein
MAEKSNHSLSKARARKWPFWHLMQNSNYICTFSKLRNLHETLKSLLDDGLPQIVCQLYCSSAVTRHVNNENHRAFYFAIESECFLVRP